MALLTGCVWTSEAWRLGVAGFASMGKAPVSYFKEPFICSPPATHISCSLHLTNRIFRAALLHILPANQISTDTVKQQASAVHYQHSAFCTEANSLFTDYLSCYDSPWHIMSSRGARVWQSAFPDGQQLLTRVSEVLIMHLQDLAWANTWLNGLDWRILLFQMHTFTNVWT